MSLSFVLLIVIIIFLIFFIFLGGRIQELERRVDKLEKEKKSTVHKINNISFEDLF